MLHSCSRSCSASDVESHHTGRQEGGCPPKGSQPGFVTITASPGNRIFSSPLCGYIHMLCTYLCQKCIRVYIYIYTYYRCAYIYICVSDPESNNQFPAPGKALELPFVITKAVDHLVPGRGGIELSEITSNQNRGV